MHAIDLVTGEFFKQPVRQHTACTAQAFFGRLEDKHHCAVEITGFRQMFGRAQQHRRVAVVTAGMHHAGGLRGIGQTGFLVDRQRIHIGAQTDAAIAAALALDDADNTGFPDAGVHLVHPVFPQLFSNDARGPDLGEPDFRMSVQILENLFKLGLALLDNWQNSHYAFPSSQSRSLCAGRIDTKGDVSPRCRIKQQSGVFVLRV